MEQLKQQLLQVVNESNLPLEAIYYVCKDFFRDVDDAYQQFLLKQLEQKEEGEKHNDNYNVYFTCNNMQCSKWFIN